MILSPQAITILLVLAVVTNILYGLVVYTRNRVHPMNRSFFILTIAASTWGAAMYGLRIDFGFSPTIIELLSQILFIAAAAIPTTFLYLAYSLPERGSLSREQKLAPAIGFATLILFVFTPTYFIQNVYYDEFFNPIIQITTLGRILFGGYLILLFGTVYTILIKKIRAAEKGVDRAQITYIFIGTLIPAVVGIFTNFLLPALGYSSFNWLGPSSIVVSTGIILYGIVKHGIFDIRVIATEILMAVLWIISFIRIVTSESLGVALFNTVAFIAVIIVGVMLIRSVTREVEAREKIERLAENLEKANAKLRVLDQQKSEFLSIATHQLRGPLAGIRGHLSLILDGSYGKITKKTEEILTKVFSSSGLLVQTVNDFLDVSRIEQGRMQYDMTEFKCDELVADIVGELEPVAKDRKLKLGFTNQCEEKQCVVHADQAKLKHIFFNLIDNAIKYTEKGKVDVSITIIDDAHIRVQVADTGVGIDPEELPTLFEKFVRARDASGINVNGTGLGLYVARQMVEAHEGKIWAESPGKGKGSTFVVELPLS